MKTTTSFLRPALVLALVLSSGLASWSAPAPAAAPSLEAGFQQPPRIARPMTWWHWMNGYATKEGITADLEAMKRVGLGGAQMFNVKMGLNADFKDSQSGPARFMSPQWRELVQHAIRESDRLGLEFSLMNCEGFSQAGGSWITPAQSMQKVVWTERPITGGQTIKLDLPRPVPNDGFYEDIALIAFPTLPGDEAVPPPIITVSAKASEPSPNPSLPVMPNAMPGKPQWVVLEFDQPREFGSVRLHLKQMRDIADPENWEDSSYLTAAAKSALRQVAGPHYWELQASDDGKNFRAISRVNTQGATPFPATRAKYFRLWMPVPPPMQKGLPFADNLTMEFTEITLAGPRLHEGEARMGAIIDYGSNRFSNRAIPPAGAVSNGTLVVLTGRKEWAAPAGQWTLVRLGHTSTGAEVGPAEIGGLEVDKLSATAVRHHLEDGVVGAIVKDAGPLAGPVFQHLLFDSFEKGLGNWTALLPQEFARRRGYSLESWLPTLTGRVVGSVDESERFLRDFRRTLADLIAANYYGTLRDYGREHGLSIYAEGAGHGLPALVDQLQCKEFLDVPMGEFWIGRFDVDDNKESASAAHIFGKPISGSESFTSVFTSAPVVPWGNDPYSLKSQGDLQFTMGVNRMIFHRYAHQPWLDRVPGMTMAQCGTNFDRTNTWWEPGRAWIEYIARCQFMLQRGRFIADACYYYGENAPVDFRFSRMSPTLPPGYDFDACNSQVLATMTVKNGLLLLPSGMVYRTLVLPDEDRMTPETIRIVQTLVRDGATVVGPKPTKSPSLAGYPESDRVVQQIASEVWGDCDGQKITSHTYGAGKIMWGGAITEALHITPDFTSDDPKVRYLHRRDGDTDIYFVSNQADTATLTSCVFRDDGRLPEIWHPDTGKREYALMYINAGSRTTVPLQLDPAGSVFVVFREQFSGRKAITSVSHEGESLTIKPADGQRAAPTSLRAPVLHDGNMVILAEKPGAYEVTVAPAKKLTLNATAVPATLNVRGPWRITFPPKAGAPATAMFTQLASWTESTDAGIKYFSGTATYFNTFTLSADYLKSDAALQLDLGGVMNLAEVTLNGKNLGVLWKPPFVVDLAGIAQAGENRLEIKVTNLWPNRLIGDKRLPANQRTTWTTYNPYTKDSPLLPSGLLGPVKIRAAKRLTVADWDQGRPTPTVKDFAYGPYPVRQTLDFWHAKSDRPTPLVVLIHGGGWIRGDKFGYDKNTIQTYLDAGISVAAINYRFIAQAMQQGIEPPVKACLDDAARALQTLRSKAKEWNIDPTRVGLSGGSAGACTSLWLALHNDLADPKSADPIARQSTRPTCIAISSAQTSLDPKQLREWMANAGYGGHAFGFSQEGRNFAQEFELLRENREKVLPWIKEYSPIEHVSSDDPPIFMEFPQEVGRPIVGAAQRDATHSAVQGIKLAQALMAAGVEVVLTYPAAPDTKYPTMSSFLIAKLKGTTPPR